MTAVEVLQRVKEILEAATGDPFDMDSCIDASLKEIERWEVLGEDKPK